YLAHLLIALLDGSPPFVAGVDDRIALRGFLAAVRVVQLHIDGVVVGFAICLHGRGAFIGTPARTVSNDAPGACRAGSLVRLPLAPALAVAGVKLAEQRRYLFGSDLPPLAIAAAGLDFDHRVLADMEVGKFAPVILGAALQRDAPVRV